MDLSSPYQIAAAATGGLAIIGIWKLLQDNGVKVRRFFEGKRMIITGASSGIGAEVAKQVAVFRTKLTLVARRVELLEEVAAQCRELGAEVLVLPGDVSVEDDCKRVVGQSVDQFQGLDVLLLNAGISMSAFFSDISDLSIFKKLLEVNYLQCVYMSHAALPHLQKSKGTIGVVSSQAAIFNPPLRSGYGAAKAAVNAFFESLRCELGSNSGVNICVLNPGFVSTDIRKVSFSASGKPAGESSYDEKGMMSAEEASQIILGALATGRRHENFTTTGWMGPLLKALSPGLVTALVRRKVMKMKKNKNLREESGEQQNVEASASNKKKE